MTCVINPTVCDDHVFKDDKLFYRFRKDDGTFEEPPDTAILAKGQRIYGRYSAHDVLASLLRLWLTKCTHICSSGSH